jgi:hypothetical protein
VVPPPDRPDAIQEVQELATRLLAHMLYFGNTSVLCKERGLPGRRECERHLAQWTLSPIASIIAQEASEKLGGSIAIDVMGRCKHSMLLAVAGRSRRWLQRSQRPRKLALILRRYRTRSPRLTGNRAVDDQEWFAAFPDRNYRLRPALPEEALPERPGVRVLAIVGRGRAPFVFLAGRDFARLDTDREIATLLSQLTKTLSHLHKK